MKVLCIKGQKGFLIEGETYTVINVTKKGNYLLNEIDPPEPYTSFDKDRFEMVSDDDLLEQLQLEDLVFIDSRYL
jgi:hypothetical protein